MDSQWLNTFSLRMQDFRTSVPGDGTPVSIKVRVHDGCFHREHSPEAYRLIDRYLAAHLPADTGFGFEEHESGPEILTWLGAGLSVAGGIISLVTAILNSRSEGIKRGDRPNAPLVIIIRSVEHAAGTEVMQISANDKIDQAAIERAVNKALADLPLAEQARAQGSELDDTIEGAVWDE